jgi:hypothetical protein
MRMIWAEHVACTIQMKNAYRILVGKRKREGVTWETDVDGRTQ